MLTICPDQKNFATQNIYISLYSEEGISVIIIPSFKQIYAPKPRVMKKVLTFKELEPLRQEDNPFYELH